MWDLSSSDALFLIAIMIFVLELYMKRTILMCWQREATLSSSLVSTARLIMGLFIFYSLMFIIMSLSFNLIRLKSWLSFVNCLFQKKKLKLDFKILMKRWKKDFWFKNWQNKNLFEKTQKMKRSLTLKICN